MMLLALAAAVAVPWPAGAADVRIGFIDSAKIFQQYKLAQEAQQRFDRQVQSWRDEAAEKEKAVNALRAEVRDQAPIVSSLRRQEREQALQTAVADYESFIQEVWGPTGRAAKENENSTREIVEQIRVVVDQLSQQKGYDMVLDAAGGSIIYANRELDLTADVLQELNNKATTTGGH
jgi:outer membrane protein